MVEHRLAGLPGLPMPMPSCCARIHTYITKIYYEYVIFVCCKRKSSEHELSFHCVTITATEITRKKNLICNIMRSWTIFVRWFTTWLSAMWKTRTSLLIFFFFHFFFFVRSFAPSLAAAVRSCDDDDWCSDYAIFLMDMFISFVYYCFVQNSLGGT